MDAEAAAVLGYLFSFPAWLVVVLGEEENEFVRFHVFQSAAYNLVVLVGMVVVFVLWTGLVWIGSFLVFFPTIPVFVFAAAPGGGAGTGATVSVLFAVVTTLFVVLFGVLFLVVALLPLVLTVAVLGYSVYVAYRASQGDRYEMPYLGDFVEQYV